MRPSVSDFDLFDEAPDESFPLEERALAEDVLHVFYVAGDEVNAGTAVFGGMVAATILGVFLIPVLYVVAQRTSQWVRGVRDE